MSQRLEDLVFSDLFVDETVGGSWYKPTPDSMETTPVPPEYGEEILELRKRLEQPRSSNVHVYAPGDKNVRLRGKRIRTTGEKDMFICRGYRIGATNLKDLGLAPQVTEELMSPNLRNGLVAFLGKPGAGKTTTAIAYVCERLRQFGGVCWTIENPVEIVIQGMHGKGRCYQTEVDDDTQMEERIQDMFRATPNILFIGEIFTRKALQGAIRAASGGTLVVFTYHGNDLISGLGRLDRTAGGSEVDIGLADVLRGVVHLELHNASAQVPRANFLTGAPGAGTGTPPRVLEASSLFMTSPEDFRSVQSIIREKNYQQLSSVITKQRNQMLNRKLPGE
jgi:Tfp pilus assembly pilus retraction ATPase PilT